MNAFGFAATAALASDGLGNDRSGYRNDFVELVKLADSLDSLADPLTRRRELGYRASEWRMPRKSRDAG